MLSYDAHFTADGTLILDDAWYDRQVRLEYERQRAIGHRFQSVRHGVRAACAYNVTQRGRSIGVVLGVSYATPLCGLTTMALCDALRLLATPVLKIESQMSSCAPGRRSAVCVRSVCMAPRASASGLCSRVLHMQQAFS